MEGNMKKLTLLIALALAFLPALNSQTTPTTPTPGTTILRALLSPSTEVPPINSQHSGNATIQVHPTWDATGNLTQAIVDFRIDYNFAGAETINAFHIHKAPAGVSGPVVIDPRFSPPMPVTGAGSVFRQVTLTAPADLTTVKDLLANPAGFYANVHTPTSPAGAIRGQLTPDVAGTVAADSAKLDAMKMQLDQVQQMLRDMARVLGLNFPL
jgi:hypothetical protein